MLTLLNHFFIIYFVGSTLVVLVLFAQNFPPALKLVHWVPDLLKVSLQKGIYLLTASPDLEQTEHKLEENIQNA